MCGMKKIKKTWIKEEEDKNRCLITLVGVEQDTYFIFHEELSVMNCGFSHPRLFSIRNATTAEQLNLHRSSPRVSLTVTKDRPQFRTQRLGQTSRRYSLSLRVICSSSIHCVHTLASLFLFFVFSPLFHPQLSASLSCFTPSLTFLTIHPLPLPQCTYTVNLWSSFSGSCTQLLYNSSVSANVHVISFSRI